jgi:hypothetical protein
MKRLKLPESKTLRAVRKIKESIAHEARNSPEYYLGLNGLGAKLLGRHRSQSLKTGRH